ncbi:MAG: T9SS type B sorting domain-containing protein [Cytophagales bacterium]|nr:T9SS type B sorting domain-containing protein [Cytophagales bacterium]
MKKFFILVSFLSLALIVKPQEAHASHASGIDITYTCLGGNNYQFELAFYRDCAGISAPTSPQLSISSASCGISATITLTKISGPVEVSTLCTGNPNSTCNGGNEPGFEQYIYSGTYTLPAQCSDWVFSFTECCRNDQITNLQSPGSEDMYVEATLNNTGGICNSSPVFTTTPVPFICVGELFCYDHATVDPDGDSLVYTLVNPLGNGQAPISYTAGYSPTYPITTTTGTVAFNSSTGEMCFTPNAAQVSVVTVLIREYRGGVLIGSTMRDIQIIILDCDQAPLEVTVPCGGNTITLIIRDAAIVCSSIAADGSDFTLTGPGGPFIITGAVGVNCGTSTDQITISLNTPVTLDSIYTLTITTGTDGNTLIDDCGNVMDDPITLVFTAALPPATISGDDPICRGSCTQLVASSGSSYLWTTLATTQSINVCPNNTTTYGVDVTNGSCLQTATFQVTVTDAPEADFTFSPNPACVGQQVQFTSTSTGWCLLLGGTCQTDGDCFLVPCQLSVSLFFWDFGDGNFSTGIGDETPTHTYNTPGTYNVSLILFDFVTGCDNTITIPITVGPAADPGWTAPGTICETAGVINLNALVTGTAGGTWSGTNVSGSTFDPTGLSGPVSITYTVGSAPCIGVSTQSITVGPDVVPGWTPPAPMCEDAGLVNLNALITGTTGGSWSGPGVSGSNFDPTGLSGNISITYTAGVSPCQESLAQNIVVFALPVITTSFIIITNSTCGSNNGSITGITVTGAPTLTYQWVDGSFTVVGSSLDLLNMPSGSYTLTVTDGNGCTSVTVPYLISDEVPDIIAGGVVIDSTLCDSATGSITGILISGGTPPLIYEWVNGAFTIVGNSLDLLNVPAGSYTLTVTDSTGCSASSGPYVVPELLAPPAPLAGSPAPYCAGDAIADLTATGTGGTFIWYADAGLTVSIFSGSPFASGAATDTSFWVTETMNGCQGPATQVVITINPIPASPAADTNATYCDGDSIADITAAGINIEWFSDPLLTVLIGAGSPFIPPVVVGVNIFYVTQTISGCQSQADSVVITVDPLPAAPVAGFDATYCVGDSVADLTATGSGSGLLIWYADAALTNIIGSGSPFTSGITTTDTFYVSEIINGCLGPADSIIITFNQKPVINTSAIVINLSSCGNADGSVTGIIATGMPPLAYVWVDGSFNIAGGDSANLMNVPSGLYNLTVTDSNGCSSVSGPHAVNDTVSLLDTNAVIVDSSDCISATGSIIGIILIGGNLPIVYEWVDQSFTVVGDSLDLTGVPAGTYYLTVVDADSCLASAGPYVINSYPLPPAPAAFSPPPFCQGDTIADLTVTDTSGVFVWYSDIGLTDSIFSGSPFASGAITDTSYWLTVTINGCESPSTQVNIIINPTPAAPIAGTDSGYCVGEPIADLSAAGLNNIEWFSDAGLTISLGTGTSLTITPGIGTTIYYVTQTTTDGCQSPADSVIISVNTSPPAPAVSGNTSWCFGDTIADLTATGSGGTLIWYSDANLTDSIGSGISFTPNPVTDTFYVAETLNGCKGPADMVAIYVNPVPVINAYPDTSIYPGESVDLYASDSTNYSYIWTPQEGLNDASSQNPIASPDSTTVYYVNVTDPNGCTAVDSLTITIIIDTCKLIIYNGISPNLDDINDSWKIESTPVCSPDKVKVIIYNRWGDKVWEDENVDYSKIIWDGTNKNGRPLPDGTYFYIIEITNGIEQQINVTKNGILLPPFETETIVLNGWVQILR